MRTTTILNSIGVIIVALTLLRHNLWHWRQDHRGDEE